MSKPVPSLSVPILDPQSVAGRGVDVHGVQVRGEGVRQGVCVSYGEERVKNRGRGASSHEGRESMWTTRGGL